MQMRGREQRLGLPLNHSPSRLYQRRGWDSNPRVTLTTTAGFQDRIDPATTLPSPSRTSLPVSGRERLSESGAGMAL
jgi:hypothetical protein